MMQVWFLFKIVETILGTCCMVYHALGFLDKEPIPHILLFCGTFFGFTLLAFMGTIGITVGATPPPLIECIINFCASVMYIVSSIVSMHFAENDFHLMYLSDFEEPLHPFFAFCRAQSICALATGSLHLLHAILALDVLFITKSPDSVDNSSSESESDMAVLDTRRPIRMYFLSKFVENKLRRYEWFDRLCSRRAPSLSIFAIGTRRESNVFVSTRFSQEEDKSKYARRLSRMPPIPKLEKTKNEEESSDMEKELKSPLNYGDYSGSSRPSVGDTIGIKNEKQKSSPLKISESASDAGSTKKGDPTTRIGSKMSTRFALPGASEIDEQPSTSTLPEEKKKATIISMKDDSETKPEKKSDKESDTESIQGKGKLTSSQLSHERQTDSEKEYDYRMSPEDTKIYDYRESREIDRSKPSPTQTPTPTSTPTSTPIPTATPTTDNVPTSMPPIINQIEEDLPEDSTSISEEPRIKIKSRTAKETSDKEQQTTPPYIDSDDEDYDPDAQLPSANDQYNTPNDYNTYQQSSPPAPPPPPPPPPPTPPPPPQ